MACQSLGGSASPKPAPKCEDLRRYAKQGAPMPAMPVVASSTLTGAVRHAVTHSESASPCARHLAPGITRQKLVAVSRCLPTDSLQPRHALFPSTADLNVEGKVLQTPGRYPTPPPKTPNLCNPWTSARLQSNGQSPQVRRCCPTAPQLAPFSETIGPSNSDFSDVGGPTKTRSFGLKKPKTSTLFLKWLSLQ